MNRNNVSYVDAISEATAQEMAYDPSVIVFGLDVDDHKAIQGTTKGLLAKFGSGDLLQSGGIFRIIAKISVDSPLIYVSPFEGPFKAR